MASLSVAVTAAGDPAVAAARRRRPGAALRDVQQVAPVLAVARAAREADAERRLLGRRRHDVRRQRGGDALENQLLGRRVGVLHEHDERIVGGPEDEVRDTRRLADGHHRVQHDAGSPSFSEAQHRARPSGCRPACGGRGRAIRRAPGGWRRPPVPARRTGRAVTASCSRARTSASASGAPTSSRAWRCSSWKACSPPA